MRPPAFWYRPVTGRGVIPYLLWPLSLVTNAFARRRAKQLPEYHPDVPVICVGNINIGGTGKTPASIAIGQYLTELGFTPHFVTRGHGGSLEGPVKVDDRRMTADQTGDEALLLAAFGPTWVSKDRAEGVRKAQENGADVIILDDGHQNPSVAKTISIVVVDAATGFGNGLVFPAGPLREQVSDGLARADLLLSVGSPQEQEQFLANWPETLRKPLNHITGELVPLQMGMDWNGTRVMPFAGIGRPSKFFATLESLGAELVNETALDDHQPLSAALLKRLSMAAKSANAQLVTTEKDAVRLPPQFRSQVLSLPVRMQIKGLEKVSDRLPRPRKP